MIMGDLSEHFNHKDFACRCPECKGGEYKVHLGMVGALEMLAEHFKKPVKVVAGYWCEGYDESLKREKVSYHVKGKAAHIMVEDVPLAEVFKYAETLPEIHGVGFYPKEGFIHVDTRPKEKKDAWIREGDRYAPATPEKRKQYGLL